MNNNLTVHLKDLKEVIDTGKLILTSLKLRISKYKYQSGNKLSEEETKELMELFETDYQEWYSISLVLVKQILPDRLNEFIKYYDSKKSDTTVKSYCIKEWFNGVRFNKLKTEFKDVNELHIVFMKFGCQVEIIKACNSRFRNSLFEIKQILNANLLKSELEQAEELFSNGYYRASGVICGVIIERHLHLVCNNHNVKPKTKKPTISEFSQCLKSNNIIETYRWRLIDTMGDIRNICSHKSNKEPTREDIIKLIQGTKDIVNEIR